MDDILRKLSSGDPHLDLRGIDVSEEEFSALAREVENNTFINRVSWKQGYLYDDTLKKRIEDIVKANNQTFQRYPNDFVFALLSNHAYTDSTNGTCVQFPSNSDDEVVEVWNQELNSWTVFKVFDDSECSKYYGVSYLNEGKKQIVLAHRGTVFKWGDLLESNSAVKTDVEGILGKNIVEQQRKAYAATKEIVAHTKKIGYNLSFTGHSLGAWLAELSVYFAVNNFDCKCKAVTFESPGSASTMEMFKPNVKSPGNDPIIRNLNITTYLSAPNLVNCSNPHAGKVFRIFPKIPDCKKFLKLKSIMKKTPIAKHLEPLLTSILSSVDSHRIEPLIATFNSETGKPKFLREVLDWPCFKYQTEVTVTKVIQNFLTSFVSCLEVLPGVGWFVHEVFSKPTFVSFVRTLVELVNGDISIQQFQKVCGSSEFITNGGEETVPLISEEEFTVRYEGHYFIKAFTPSKDYYNPDSTDYYLNELHELSTKEINKMKICDDLKQFLNKLKATYEIKFDALNGQRYIHSKSSDIHIDDLREKMLRLCEIYSELKEVFDSKQSFLPQDMPLNQFGKIRSNLPLRSNKFIERPEVMKEIEEGLEQHKFVAISAFGGTGKSTMAVEYGRSLREKCNGQVVKIINADCPDKINTAYKDIAKFDYGITIEDQTANLMQFVHSKIANSESVVLFIFDNVEKYEDIEAYLEALSNVETVKVIITTRHNDLSENLQTIKLNPFTKDEAKLYIKNATGNRFSLHDIDKLVSNLVGKNFFLPFNLSLSVAYFKLNPLYKVDRCLKILEKCNGETSSFLLRDLMNTSESAWLILQYSAYLDPDFTDTVTFQKLLGVDVDELQVDVEKLGSLGLMSLRRLENGKLGLKVHRLLQDLVKKYADANEGLERVINKPDIFERILKALYNIYLSEKDEFACFQLCSQAGDVINNCLSWLREFGHNSSNLPIFVEKVESAIGIISNLGPIIKHYGQDAERIATGVAGGSQDPLREGESPPLHPSRWFGNLQTFVHHAHCSFDIGLDEMLFINQEGLKNQVFKRYPNDFVLGLLNCDVYVDHEEDIIVEFPENSGVGDVKAWDEELESWTVLEVLYRPEFCYYGVVYSNDDKKQIVLAHHCLTEKLVDFVEHESKTDALLDATDDATNDASNDATNDASDDEFGDYYTLDPMIMDRVGAMIIKARFETDKVINYAKKKGYTLSFTGHSFGAYLAVFSLNVSWLLHLHKECKVVTFDYPPFPHGFYLKGVKSTILESLTNFRSVSPKNQNRVFGFLQFLESYCILLPKYFKTGSLSREFLISWGKGLWRAVPLFSIDMTQTGAAADDDESN